MFSNQIMEFVAFYCRSLLSESHFWGLQDFAVLQETEKKLQGQQQQQQPQQQQQQQKQQEQQQQQQQQQSKRATFWATTPTLGASPGCEALQL
jgi:FtsZ-interacting cell division protein YlmF